MNDYPPPPESVRTYLQIEIVNAYRFPVDGVFDVEDFERDLQIEGRPGFDKRGNLVIEHFQKGKVSVEPGQWILLDQSTGTRSWNLDDEYFQRNYKRTEQGWKKRFPVQAVLFMRENAAEVIIWAGKTCTPPVREGGPWQLKQGRNTREFFPGDFLVKNQWDIVWPVQARVFAHSHVLVTEDARS